MDDTATNPATTIASREAVSRDPDPGSEAPINANPEIPSNTVRMTPKGALIFARVFRSAVTTANPPNRKRRMRGRKSLIAQYGGVLLHRNLKHPLATPGSSRQSTPAMTLPPNPQSRSGAGYWRKNLTYVGALLVIWFAISYGAGILFVESLNRVRIPGTGFPLGFWFAQQGSIYVFVVLIFVYVYLMNRLDREFGVDEDAE